MQNKPEHIKSASLVDRFPATACDRTENMTITLLNVFCALDFIHKITVQASPGLEKRRNSPDLGSPSIGPRFRAIQRKYRTYKGEGKKHKL